MITDDYRALNAELHKSNAGYGAGGGQIPESIKVLMRAHDDVLDYGCGKATLRREFPRIACYDPAILEHAALPQPADIVICRDVMEHVEGEFIDAVLDHIKTLARKAAWFAIATRPAKKHLADGRNAHVSIYPGKWWESKLTDRWEVVSATICDREIVALCEKAKP